MHCGAQLNIAISTKRRRVRSVRLDSLVKAKYKGLEDVRAREGDHAAMEEFIRRRRGLR